MFYDSQIYKKLIANMKGKKHLSDYFNEFRKNIRKHQIQQFKLQKRNSMIQISRIITIGQKFNIEESTIRKIKNYQNLFQICFQKLCSPYIKYEEDQELFFCKQIQAHIQLLRQIKDFLKDYSISQKFEKLFSTFLLIIITKYCPQNLNIHKEYEKQFYEIIVQSCQFLQQSFIQKFIEWTTNLKGVRTLYQMSLSKQMKRFLMNSKFLDILHKSIQKQSKYNQKQAVYVLSLILKDLDRYQIYQIQKKYPLFISSIVQNLDQQLFYNQDLSNYCIVLLYLLSSSTQTIIDNSNNRFMYICTKMINSQLQENIYGGLSLINLLCQTKSFQTIENLKINSFSQQHFSWLRVSLDLKVYNHDSESIKNLFFMIVRNIICQSSFSQILEFQNQLIKKGINFPYLFEIAFFTQNDVLAYNCLQIINRLLYIQDDLSFEKKIAFGLQQLRLIPIITSFAQNSAENIRQQALDILQRIHQIQRFSLQIQI